MPAVRQIVDNLRVLLVDKKLLPGALLPSVRRLAMELGVNFNTVAEAYRELETEGWLDLHHGRAAVVITRPAPTASSEAWISEFRMRLRGLIAQTQSQGASKDAIATELSRMSKAMEK
jgi:GntR family transcriptional regulator